MSQEEEFIKKCVEESRKLMEMPEEVRTKYVKDVFGFLKKMYTDVLSEKSLAGKKKKWDKWSKVVKERRAVIIACMVYAMKPEFRDEMMEILIPLIGLV